MSADTVQVVAGDLDLGTSLSARQIAVQSRLGPMTVGGTSAPASGLWLDRAEFARITASARLDLYAGTTAGTARGDLLVQDVDVTPQRTPVVNLYAGAGSDVFVRGQIAPTVSGAVLTVGDGATGSAWTPRSIQVSGAIGTSTRSGDGFTGVRAFDSVVLNAGGDVFLGSQRFIGLVSPSAATSIDIARGAPGGVQATPDEANHVFLTAGTLSVTASGRLVGQNTAPTAGDFAGVYLTNPGRVGAVLTIDPPSVVDLFGAFVDRNGTLQKGLTAAASPAIRVVGQEAVNYDYRFNGCVIGLIGGCDLFNSSRSFRVDQFVLVRPDELTDSPLLTTAPDDDSERQTDPVVTGAGNEEIWRKAHP